MDDQYWDAQMMSSNKMSDERIERLEMELSKAKATMNEVADWLMLEHPVNSRTYEKGNDLKTEAQTSEEDEVRALLQFALTEIFVLACSSQDRSRDKDIASWIKKTRKFLEK